MSFFVIILIFILIISFRRNNSAYILLIALFGLSFFSQFLVGRSIDFFNLFSIFNIVFICVNVYLIVYPWSYSNILSVIPKNLAYFKFLKKILFKVLYLNLFLNFSILFIIYTYIPNIAEFKAEHAFLKLYDQIPFFANIFRYAFVSQNLGYLAIPIFFFHLGRLEKKESFKSIIVSSSSLVSGFAFYSRAQIFTFVLVFLSYFFLIKQTLPTSVKKLTTRYLNFFALIISVLFILITILRFSAMDYYGDRIPTNSYVQNPILYSIFDYLSQGFSNGYNILEKYTLNKNLYGEQLLRDVYQILDFFGISSWNAKDFEEKLDFAYDYDAGAFYGYTAPMVYNFGYIITFSISLIYFFVVRFSLKRKNHFFLETNLKVIFLLFIPIVSIFYVGYPLLYFPFFLLFIIRILYKFKMLFFRV